MRRHVIALLTCGLAACGGDSGTSAIEISVMYPNQAADVSTNSLHFWVLELRDGTVDAAAPPGCNQLVATDADPYDPGFDRLADFVVVGEDVGTAEEIPRRAILVHAHAVDFVGRTHLAGCAALTPAAGTEPVTLALKLPGTFDCADPSTEDGAPCDDGTFCNAGETCSGGTCGGGGPPDCTFVADQCNAEACSEELGCHAEPLSDGRTCEDGDYCTAGDTCQEGLCEPGGDRDCSASDGTCRRGVCNESSNQCVSVVDNTLACDDARYCTVVDSCSAGTCGGPVTSCAPAADACNSATCSEAALGACVRTPINQGLLCNTNCTTGGTCDAGACTGGTPQTPGIEGPMGDATCTDYLDNDCDGLFDANDTDCQG